MVKVEYIPVSIVKSLRRPQKKSPIVKEYESILKKLPEGQSGKIDAKKAKEKPTTVRNRLQRVANSLNITDLNIKRMGDAVYFWRE